MKKEDKEQLKDLANKANCMLFNIEMFVSSKTNSTKEHLEIIKARQAFLTFMQNADLF